MITLYGIKNCDTVKKARKWLENQSVEYTFHDVREDGLDPKTVELWLEKLGWEIVVNKRSTTWKDLDQAARDTMNNASAPGSHSKVSDTVQTPSAGHRPRASLRFFCRKIPGHFQSPHPLGSQEYR